MRNTVKCVLLLLLVLLLCVGCVPGTGEASAPAEPEANEASTSAEPEIVEEGQNYRILSMGPFSYEYVILDNSGDEVLRKSVGGRPLTITDLENDTLDVAVGMGTGLTLHRYYDAANDRLSEEYAYVLAVSGDTIAYIDVPKENPMEGRRVVVQDAFDPTDRLGAFAFPFAQTDMPVAHAEFLNGTAQLQITYYTEDGEATELVALR